jgi:anthranilate synthase component 2
MIMIIDNYDSFTYNLYQFIGQINPDIKVYRNNQISVDEVQAMKPSHIVISPGPGYPSNAGVSIELIKTLGKYIPMLGVCLGHQAIAEAYGGRIIHANNLMHGKSSNIILDLKCKLFKSLSAKISAGRYHSLIIEKENLPCELKITAEDENGDIMGIAHKKYPVFGVQFHPESILTPSGITILKNFIEI